MKTFLFYIHLVLTLLMTLPNMSKLKSLKKTLSEEEYLNFCKKTAQKFALRQVKYSKIKFNILGEENIPEDDAVLFVSNHQSNFDLAFFIGYLKKPAGYVSKDSLNKIPILRVWMRELKCVFLDRSDMKKSLKAILEGIDVLKSGQSLVLFPEGTRSKGSEMAPFKAGSFKLATKSKVPIVPVTIDGTYKIFEGNGNKLKSANVDVYIHPPIYTNNLTKEEESELSEKVQYIIASKLKSA